MTTTTQRSRNPAETPEIGMLPNNVEAEFAVVGALMLDEEFGGGRPAMAKIAWLTAPDFWNNRARAAFEAALRVYHRGDPIDPIVVTRELVAMGVAGDVKPSEWFASAINSAPNGVHIEHYARLVREAAERRRGVEVGGKLVSLYHDSTTPLTEAHDTSRRLILDMLSSTPSEAFTADQAVYDVLPQVEEMLENPVAVRGTPSPWSKLTRLLIGGFRPGWLVMLAARPGMSKTRIATACLLTAAKHGWAYMASLEMSREDLVTRMAAARANVNWSAHVAGSHAFRPDEAERFRTAMGEIAGEQFVIRDTSRLTMHAIGADVERVMLERGPVSLVVIDYLALVKPSERVESEAIRIETTARDAKDLARQLRVPVLLLHQINRQEGGRPSLAGLRYGGEQDPDVILYAYDEDRAIKAGEIKQRERLEGYGKPVSLEGKIEIGVLKHRFGEMSRLWLDNDPERGQLTQWETITEMQEARR